MANKPSPISVSKRTLRDAKSRKSPAVCSGDVPTPNRAAGAPRQVLRYFQRRIKEAFAAGWMTCRLAVLSERAILALKCLDQKAARQSKTLMRCIKEDLLAFVQEWDAVMTGRTIEGRRG